MNDNITLARLELVKPWAAMSSHEQESVINLLFRCRHADEATVHIAAIHDRCPDCEHDQ